MTRSHSIIPFHDLVFHDEMLRPQAVEERLKKFLRAYRLTRQEREIEEGRLSPDDAVARHELLDDKDRSRIRRRAVRYLERVDASSGMQHLSVENRLRLGSLQGGLPIARIETEHEADEIASALHTEMPWMARATEEVWHGLRACARDGLPGVRFNPLVLVGSPGIGKSFWARRLAHHLAIPNTKIEATGEPANFSLIGSQKGWNNASPGKLMATVLRERHAGPLVIVDEIENVGEVHSHRGARMALTDALLPLLERMTAETWECPFFQVRFDMSWTNWVLTALLHKSVEGRFFPFPGHTYPTGTVRGMPNAV